MVLIGKTKVGSYVLLCILAFVRLWWAPYQPNHRHQAHHAGHYLEREIRWESFKKTKMKLLGLFLWLWYERHAHFIRCWAMALWCVFVVGATQSTSPADSAYCRSPGGCFHSKRSEYWQLRQWYFIIVIIINIICLSCQDAFWVWAAKPPCITAHH